MKIQIASALLALTVSFSSFARCALSTNHPLAAEILTEKGFKIVENRADALFHIEVVDSLETSGPSCSLGLCKIELKRQVGVSALNSIDMKAFNLKSSKSKSVVFRKKSGPKIEDNSQEIESMLNALDEHLMFQYNDCRPRANE